MMNFFFSIVFDLTARLEIIFNIVSLDDYQVHNVDHWPRLMSSVRHWPEEKFSICYCCFNH